MDIQDLQGMFNNKDSQANLTFVFLNLPDISRYECLVDEKMVVQGNPCMQKIVREHRDHADPTRVLITEDSEVILSLVRDNYGFPQPHQDAKSPKFWATMAFGLPFGQIRRPLQAQAEQNLWTIACQQSDAVSVRDLIDLLESLAMPRARRTITKIRKHHAAKLLVDSQYLSEVLQSIELVALHAEDFHKLLGTHGSNDNNLPNNILNNETLNHKVPNNNTSNNNKNPNTNNSNTNNSRTNSPNANNPNTSIPSTSNPSTSNSNTNDHLNQNSHNVPRNIGSSRHINTLHNDNPGNNSHNILRNASSSRLINTLHIGTHKRSATDALTGKPSKRPLSNDPRENPFKKPLFITQRRRLSGDH